MLDLSGAAVVDFPLRGEWRAIQTPAERVPSHGTDFFAQRYALDLVRMDKSGTWYYPGGTRALLRHLSVGIPARAFHGWDQPVRAVSPGRVLAVGEGWPDRDPVRLLPELLRTTLVPPRLSVPGDHRPLAGNHAIVQGAEGVALYAHLRAGSVTVVPGQRVAAGEVLGTVGNSGNSTMPHLHFHLMDGPDPLTAAGLLVAFRGYERWTEGGWEPVERGVPGALERVRCVPAH